MNSTGQRMKQDWESYDSVATIYDSLVVPHEDVLPARDLVAILRVPVGGLVLDVGTGSGVAALLAQKAVGAEGVVVGLDPSLEMLRVALAKGVSGLAAGLVPGLPFRKGVFDAVLANFVLSHFTRYDKALIDMVRVLKPGGRVGVTAWGAGKSEFSQVWQDTADSFISRDILRSAGRQAIPWEEWFSDAKHLWEAFQDVGLVSIELQQREYEVSVTVADYLAIRETFSYARLMRQTLSAGAWERFRQQVAEAFQARFREPLEYTNHVHLAVGTKPYAQG